MAKPAKRDLVRALLDRHGRTRLVAALVRTDLAGDYDEIRDAARAR